MSNGNIIPLGTYPGRCIADHWGFVGDPPKQKVVLMFEVTDGEWQGERLIYDGFFTEKTMAHTFKALRACGWTGDDLADVGALDQDVELVIEHENYEGNIRAKVRWVNKPGEGGFKMAKPMSPTDRKAFAAQMRDAVRAQSQSAGPKKPASPPPRPSGNGSRSSGHDERNPPPADFPDDIPFGTSDIAAEPHAMGYWREV